MKRPLIIFFFFLGQHLSFSQISWNINLLSRWDNDSSPTTSQGIQYNEVTGWYQQSKNKEYAILGGIDSIYFFDVTDATSPKLIVAKPGYSKHCINRDFAIKNQYLYCVADQGKAALEIYNMSYLPDSVSLVYSNDSLSQNCHTICVYNDLLFMASNKRSFIAHQLDIIDISNPEKPHLSYSLNPPKSSSGFLFNYVHDVAIRKDTLYCFCGNDGVHVFDITQIAKPKYLNGITQYPGQGFCHSGTLYGNHLFFTDENNGKGVKNYNIEDIYNPFYINSVSSNVNAIPHDTYVKDSFLWLSSYQDGVTVWNIKNPDNPILAAYYDTYPQNKPNEYLGFKGCWGLYMALPSGIILASDLNNGLFILQPHINLNIQLAIYNQNKPVDVFTMDGKLIYKNKFKDNLNLLDLPNGIYILKQENYSEKYITIK